ncbi:MAG: DUF3847 domain-containing protein [Clostridiales bacterium]|nr:DUF3847 domain-containing protein [Clostridiales bacterium]
MGPEKMSLEELARLQEEHRRQMEEKREKIRQQKARTHKLVVIGATTAKYKPELLSMDDDDIRIRVSGFFGH